MGDHHSKALLQKLVPSVDGTVLEIGSLDNGDGKATSLRDFYKGQYYGIDIQAGNNVDIVEDICDEDAWRRCLELCPKLIYAISVFEHLPRPWIAADFITNILHPDGYFFISVPWIWRWHGYPDDYFRYSFSGIKSLFPHIEWIYQGTCSQDGRHEEYKLDQTINDNHKILKYNGQKFLPYTMINMLGRET